MLEKEMAAYSDDDSEEVKQKLQQISVDLQSAKDDLAESEYDKYISDQQILLDNLFLEYENILNSRLDNIDFLLQQVIDGINATAGAEGTLTSALGAEGAIAMAIVSAVGENGSIKNILNKEVTAVGTSLSNAMNNIWTAEGKGTNPILATYGAGFQQQQSTTNQTLDGIKKAVDKMAGISDKNAADNVNANRTSGSDKKDPTKDNAPTPTPKPSTSNSTGDGKPKVGDKVKFVSGQYYYDSQGKKPLGSRNRGKQVYITSINTAKWATHPIHISTGKKLGTGDLGWLKKEQISGYATGKKKISNNEYAWTQEKGREFIVRPSDGAILTPVAKNDSVLNAKASNNIWDMANNPTDFIKNNLGLDTANIPNDVNINNNVTQNFENVVFSMPNVRNYEEMLSAMQKDKNFERLVLSMTFDQVAGKSKLTKNKAIR